MNARQQTKRMFFCAVAAGLVMAAGCSSHPVRPDVVKYAARADFKIRFTESKVVITPNWGYAMVQLVQSPGKDDNKVVWVSKDDQFEIKFRDAIDPNKPPPAPLPSDWTPALGQPGNWYYEITFDQGREIPEIRAVKYSVRHISGSPVEDPVLIVRN